MAAEASISRSISKPFQLDLNSTDPNIDTFPYLDNTTVAGHTQAEHNENVKKS